MMIENPLRELLEAKIVEMSGAVEPGSRRACDADPIIAHHHILRAQHVGSPDRDTSGDRGPIMRDQYFWNLRDEHVAEVPQACRGRARDNSLTIGDAGRDAAALEAVRRSRDAEHADVHADQNSRLDEAPDG